MKVDDIYNQYREPSTVLEVAACLGISAKYVRYVTGRLLAKGLIKHLGEKPQLTPRQVRQSKMYVRYSYSRGELK
jgi:Mn-dependent DtxR family transcriptional regulator